MSKRVCRDVIILCTQDQYNGNYMYNVCHIVYMYIHVREIAMW